MRISLWRAGLWACMGLLTVSAWAQRQVSVVAGDQQAVRLEGIDPASRTAYFAPLSVLVKENGIPVPGVKVGFNCPQATAQMMCQIEPSGLGGVIVTTDANGVATLQKIGGKSVMAYRGTGKAQVVATAEQGHSVVFNLTVLEALAAPGPVKDARLDVVSGDKQAEPLRATAQNINMAVFAPLQARLTDAKGSPIANAQVNWTCTAPSGLHCSISPHGQSTTVTTTDAQGLTALRQFADGASIHAYYGEGKLSLVASHGSAKATFSLVVGIPAGGDPLPRREVSVLSGNGQSVRLQGIDPASRTAYFEPMSVLVKEGGKPVAGVPVGFGCPQATAQMTCQIEPSGLGGVTVTTDANGVATLKKIGGKSVLAYRTPGSGKVTAGAERGNVVTFDFTVLEAPAPPAPVAGAQLRVLSGNRQTEPLRMTAHGFEMARFQPMLVLLTDEKGSPIRNAQVTWVCTPPSPGTACSLAPHSRSTVVTVTDDRGMASPGHFADGAAIHAYYGSDGPLKLVASHGQARAVFEHMIGPQPVAGAQLAVVAGDRQVSALSTGTGGRFAPLKVRLLDANGKPVAQAPVYWRCEPPSGMQCDTGSSTHMVRTLTDQDGVATLGHLDNGKFSIRASKRVGWFRVTATHGEAATGFSMRVSL